MDLDKFKEINDAHGHSAGDYVLREVAHRFHSVLPEGSYLSRLGGDEFAALVEREVESARALAGRLQVALTTPIYVGESSLLLTASIGVTELTAEENPLERADAQMYEAKRAAR
jgi:diguanylate cyclase (GGDEF)-like protein